MARRDRVAPFRHSNLGATRARYVRMGILGGGYECALLEAVKRLDLEGIVAKR